MHKELRNHVIKLLNGDLRLDGRKPDEFREIQIDYDVINTAEGSARVKVGETEVIAGVKMEIIEPYPDSPDMGTIMVGAELLPLSSPDFESGPPGIQAVELARVVDRGIRESKAVDFKKLCVAHGQKAWCIMIDVCTINDAGNLLDTSALASLAALKVARYPSYDGEKIDYKKRSDKMIDLSRSPIAVTVVKIGGKFIVDPSIQEEKVIDSRLTVTSDEYGVLCALQKGGSDPLTDKEIEQMIEIGIEKAQMLRRCLK